MTSEKDIENSLIQKLVDLKYTYRPDIRDNAALETNFKKHFSNLNRVNLSKNEFRRLKETVISNDVFTCSKMLREKNTFSRDDGTDLHYSLVDIDDWCKNSFEVINQLRINTANTFQRYDVIILLNGLPLIQIELKKYDILPRKAMQQIVDYKTETGNGYTNSLLCFMQLFIVSNKTSTWYFANNNAKHYSFGTDEQFLPMYQFADQQNAKITHLDTFAETFLAKCTLGAMISKYMVLVVSEQKLIMMRPYQIYAVQQIMECIQQNRGNGYIWHTTGSGKTLTSFKASTLLKNNPNIEKCLFVVDRKDLDKQTRDEFNKFQENCVEENTNTQTLVDRLLSTEYTNKVIVTTIQKLGLALDGANKKQYAEKLKPLQKKRMVFIFDECHRSQFGENHQAIKEFFPNSQLFGFTGTPIFAQNAIYTQIDGQEKTLLTTQDIFQKCLHTYTITHAIEDRNVLRFYVDYYKPDKKIQQKAGTSLTQEAIINAILTKHNAATSNRRFNALFATSSINDAIAYHSQFAQIQKEKQKTDSSFIPLNIACVFSPPAEGNKDIQQTQEDLQQEKFDNKDNPEHKKSALKEIIATFNQQYGTNHDITNFDLYYQDIQQRIKDHKYTNNDYAHKNKIDITIVVDMLLTGFDSKYLNTLYVDKNLKHHGLIQAFSRTNRILNDTKQAGLILDFRAQQKEVDAAITLFSGEDIEKAKQIWLVEPAVTVITYYETALSALTNFMQSQNLEAKPEDVFNLKGQEAKINFIKLFREVQHYKTQLDQYTDITQEQVTQIEQILPTETLTRFKGAYLETAQQLKETLGNPAAQKTTEQVEFDFILFASAIIDYDYIMHLISEYSNATPQKQKMTREQLIGLIASDAKFMDEKHTIAEYITNLKTGEPLTEQQVKDGYEDFKTEKQNKVLTNIATAYSIELNALNAFIELTISRYVLDEDALRDLFAPLNLNWKERVQKEVSFMKELLPILNEQAKGKSISGVQAYVE